MPNQEHERAVYAYEKITAVDTNFTDDDKKNYRALIQSAGPLIHQAGLFQTLGFYFQKKKTHHLELSFHILKWLFPNVQVAEPVHQNLYFQYLLNSTDEEALYYTSEVQALILWLKRFAVAILPERRPEEAE